jgi:hypothetical protein
VSADPEELRQIADLLDKDANFEVVADAITEAREKAPRLREHDGRPIDRDSGDVLDDVITALRSAADD